MQKSFKSIAVGVLAAGVLFVAPSAFAADSVTQAVTGGSLSASVADLALGSVATTHSAGTGTGSMTLSVDDLTGTGAGWHVTELVSDFVYTGSNDGADIPAVNFSITPGAVTPLGGASTTGVTTGSPGTLDAAKTVVTASAGNGEGNYTQSIAASLTIPANSRVGTYTGTLTTTVTAAP